jgi:hypothetical protein
VSNQQGVSSVCGNISGGLATYLFWDDDKKDCFYKTSSIANQNIKIGRNLSTATIYPNPASNTIQFNLQDFNGLFDYTIYDLSRKVVKQEIRIPNNSKISIEGLPKGLYIIEMIGNEFFSAEKLVIQ